MSHHRLPALLPSDFQLLAPLSRRTRLFSQTLVHYRILGFYLRYSLPHKILRERGVFSTRLLQPEDVGHQISEAPAPVLPHHTNRM